MRKLFTLLSALISPFTAASYEKSNSQDTITTNRESEELQTSEQVLQPFDIESITAKEIINYRNEYTIKNKENEEITIKVDQIQSLENNLLESLLTSNLSWLVALNLTGIDKTNLEKFAKGPLNDLLNFLSNDYSLIHFLQSYNLFSDILKYRLNDFLNEAEIEKLIICPFFWKAGLIKTEVKVSENEQNSRKIIATIEKASWNQSDLENKLDNLKIKLKEVLAIDLYGLYSDNIENPYSKNCQIIEQINLDSIKSMYDLIKGEAANIEIDLTNNQ